MTQFKSGDLVVLKSGGPTMTVDTVNTDIFDDAKITGVLCVWFVGDIMQRVRFDHRALRLAAARQDGLRTSDGAGAGPAHGAANGAAAATALRASVTLATPEIVPATVRVKVDAPGPSPRPAEPAASMAQSEAVEPPAPAAATVASEITTAPPAATPEPVGDYAAVLDSMVGAMNATAELMAPAPRPPRRAKATTRVARGKDTTTH